MNDIDTLDVPRLADLSPLSLPAEAHQFLNQYCHEETIPGSLVSTRKGYCLGLKINEQWTAVLWQLDLIPETNKILLVNSCQHSVLDPDSDAVALGLAMEIVSPITTGKAAVWIDFFCCTFGWMNHGEKSQVIQWNGKSIDLKTQERDESLSTCEHFEFYTWNRWGGAVHSVTRDEGVHSPWLRKRLATYIGDFCEMPCIR